MDGEAEIKDKEVDFYKYCNLCAYSDNAEYEEPCDECLTHTVNAGSTKPVCYEQKRIRKRNRKRGQRA